MISQATLRLAAELADSLVERGLVLTTPNNNTLVATMAARYHVGSPNMKLPLSHKAVRKLKEDFGRYNNDKSNDEVNDAFDTLVKQIVMGQRRDLYNLRQVLVPLIQDTQKRLSERTQHSSSSVNTNVIFLPTLLSSTSLTGHLESYPNKYALKESYPSIRVWPSFDSIPSAELLREWLCAYTHLDTEQVGEWLLSINIETVQSALEEMFVLARSFDVNTIHWLRPHNLIKYADTTLAMYMLTAHMRDNPMDVSGVALDQWEDIIGDIHGMLGLKLVETIQQRHRQIKAGRPILSVNVHDNGRLSDYSMTVDLCGDVVTPWLNKGGDIRAIMGAVAFPGNEITARNITLADIEASSDGFIKAWERRYSLIKTAQEENQVSTTRNSLRWAVLDAVEVHRGKFSDEKYEEIRENVANWHEWIGRLRVDVTWDFLAEVICRVVYPNRPYVSFLQYMNSKTDIEPRQAALQAHLHSLSLWYRSQVTVMKFTPDESNKPVNPDAVTVAATAPASDV